MVGTISLGSHTVAHYYQHEPSEQAVISSDLGSRRDPASGQTIDQTPILSVFLEPRSLIVTTDELYTKHLHGIDSTPVDHFRPHEFEEEGRSPVKGHFVANWKMVEDQQSLDRLSGGGSMPRSTRISLTCRDVEKVVSGNARFLGRR